MSGSTARKKPVRRQSSRFAVWWNEKEDPLARGADLHLRRDTGTLVVQTKPSPSGTCRWREETILDLLRGSYDMETKGLDVEAPTDPLLVRLAEWGTLLSVPHHGYRITSADPQSLESPDTSDRELARTKERIKNAFDTMPPVVALRDIRATWAALDDAAGLAEARTRLLIGKIDPPKMSPTLPAWATKGFDALLADEDDDSVPLQPAAVESAKRLLAAALEVSNGLEAEIDGGPSGQVVVDWRAKEFRVQWMVGVSPIGWPGVMVNALARIGSGRSAVRETRTFHDAFGVLEHFQEQLSRSGR